MSTTQLLAGSHLRTAQNSSGLMCKKSASGKRRGLELSRDSKSTTMTSSNGCVIVFISVDDIHLTVRLGCSNFNHPLLGAGIAGESEMAWGIGFCHAIAQPKYKRTAKGIAIRIQDNDMILSPQVQMSCWNDVVTVLGKRSSDCEDYATTRLRIDMEGEGGEREPTRAGPPEGKTMASESAHEACRACVGGVMPSARSNSIEGAGQE
jgi:hypothetical protein